MIDEESEESAEMKHYFDVVSAELEMTRESNLQKYNTH